MVDDCVLFVKEKERKKPDPENRSVNWVLEIGRNEDITMLFTELESFMLSKI